MTRNRRGLYPINNRFPCPICGYTKWCRFGPHVVICMRVQSDRRSRAGGWIHPLDERRTREARREIRERQRRQLLAEMVAQGPQEDTSERLGLQVQRLFAMFNRHGHRTRRQYRQIWEDLARFAGHRYGLNRLNQIQPEHVAAYLAHLKARGDSEGALNQRLSAIDGLHALLPGRVYRGSIRCALNPATPAPRHAQGRRLMPQARAIVRRLTDLAPGTRGRYGLAWYRFVTWVESHTRVRNLRNLRPEHLRGYVTSRREQGVGAQAMRWEVYAIEAIHRQVPQRNWRWRLSEGLEKVEPAAEQDAGGKGAAPGDRHQGQPQTDAIERTGGEGISR